MGRIGLALGGGGSRGAYQIGAARALAEAGILERVEVFSGTSIGAVNAALLACLPPARALELWLDVSPDEIRSAEGTFRRIVRERTAVAEKGLYTIEPLARRLRTYLPADVLARREVYVTVARGGTSGDHFTGLVKSLYRHYLGRESNVLYCGLADARFDDAVDAILASCSIPLVFPPRLEGRRQFFDGGLFDNMPIRPLVDAGCDRIVAIHLFGFEAVNRTSWPQVRLLEIRPSTSLGWMLNFDPAKAEKLAEIGYADTREALRRSPPAF